MREYFPEPKSTGRIKQVELVFLILQQEQIYKMQQVLIHQISLNNDLANLKCNVDKLDIDKLKNVPTILDNLKSKVDKLDVDNLVPVPVDLNKLSDAVKNDDFKKDVYNAQIKHIEDKIPDITNLATNTTFNAKINKVKSKIPNITNLASTAALTAVKKEIPNVSN